MNLSPAKQKALETAQSYFRSGTLHSSTVRWQKDARENYLFYSGSDNAQWREQDLAVLSQRNQSPITINVVQGFIDALSGVEIQSRYRTACRSDSGKDDAEKLAAACTHYLFHIQEHQKIPFKGSAKFRDMLITGIGWSNQYEDNSAKIYEYINPFNVIPDPDCLDPQFKGMKYVCAKHWARPDRLKALYPHIFKDVDFNELYDQTLTSPELTDRQSGGMDVGFYQGYNQSRIPIIEVQYRIQKKSYCGIDQNDYYFETFDEEKAEKLAGSKKDIQEKQADRIMRTVFTGSILLEHAPLNPDLPNMEDFSYIPCVWKRRFDTGVSYGLMESLKDIARDCNVRITKSIYLINSSRMVVSGNINPGKSVELLRQELKRNDSVIVLPPNTNYQLESNAPLGKEQMDIVEKYLSLMQRITGVHDEMLGIQTNATSAVAQNVRQVNSVRNNVYGFDNFSDMKEREARFFLNLLQGGEDENILVEIMTEQERERIILNLVREIDGKKQIFNDIRTLPISLYIEEVPDYKSTFEEQKQMLQALLGNSNANWIMMSPKLLEMMGVRDGEKIAAEMRQAMQERAMFEQSIAQMQARGGQQGIPAGNMANPQQPIAPAMIN